MKKTVLILCLSFCASIACAQQTGVYTDSVYSAYGVYSLTDSCRTVRNFVRDARRDTFLLDEVDRTLYKDGRMSEYLEFDGKGDTSLKVLYVYSDTNDDVAYYRYKYGQKKARLKHEGHFFGTRLMDNEILRLLGEFLEYEIYICDSMELMAYNTLLDVRMSGRFFGNVAQARPDSLLVQTSIAGIAVTVRGCMKAADTLLTDLRMTLSALDGKVCADLLKAHADYNADGQMVRLEIWPFKTPVYNLYKEMGGFSRREYVYEGQLLRCCSEYASTSEDTADITYKLHRRTYCTYRGGLPDSTRIYTDYEEDPSVASVPSAADMLEVEIGPNPADGQLTVRGLEQPARLEIYSPDGRRMLVRELERGENRIPLQPLARGIYFVKLQQDSRCCVKKIVKR